MVLALMAEDARRGGLPVLIDPASPDPRDPGKFSIDGKPARAIHHFSGWHPPIHLDWFGDGYDPPCINGRPFHWYAFAIPRLRRREADHYFVCDYLQMRQWVREFAAPKGVDHRDHTDWRADLRIHEGRRSGFFRWGDEPIDFTARPESRCFPLDNLADLCALRSSPTFPIGARRGTGESEAHRLLKEFVLARPGLLELSDRAEGVLEHPFRTGDRVDVFFRNHRPERSVVEIEVEGRDALMVGVHQAIKYRSLAEAADRFPMHSSRVRAYVVAYDVGYDEVREEAERYDVRLVEVDRRKVLLDAS